MSPWPSRRWRYAVMPSAFVVYLPPTRVADRGVRARAAPLIASAFAVTYSVVTPAFVRRAGPRPVSPPTGIAVVAIVAQPAAPSTTAVPSAAVILQHWHRRRRPCDGAFLGSWRSQPGPVQVPELAAPVRGVAPLAAPSARRSNLGTRVATVVAISPAVDINPSRHR